MCFPAAPRARPPAHRSGRRSYTTLSQAGNLVQGADLSGAVSIGPSRIPGPDGTRPAGLLGDHGTPERRASQATFLNGTASGDAQIDLSGSAAQLNTAVGEFMYFPPSGTTPTATINMFA